MAAETGRHEGETFSPSRNSPYRRISYFTAPLPVYPDGISVLSSMAEASPCLFIGRCFVMSTRPPCGGTDLSAARTRYGPSRELMHSAAWRVLLSNCGSQGLFSREMTVGLMIRNHWKASRIEYAAASLESPNPRATIGNLEDLSFPLPSDRQDPWYQSQGMTLRVWMWEVVS